LPLLPWCSDVHTLRMEILNVEVVGHTIINRKAVNELRSEMDRDATMLKAKARLPKRKDTP
jgi:hypothetical protein